MEENKLYDLLTLTIPILNILSNNGVCQLLKCLKIYLKKKELNVFLSLLVLFL